MATRRDESVRAFVRQTRRADDHNDRVTPLSGTQLLDPDYTGHGYATEAVRELLRYCFHDLRVRRVTASCFLDNVISWRLMERVGR